MIRRDCADDAILQIDATVNELVLIGNASVLRRDQSGRSVIEESGLEAFVRPIVEQLGRHGREPHWVPGADIRRAGFALEKFAIHKRTKFESDAVIGKL